MNFSREGDANLIETRLQALEKRYANLPLSSYRLQLNGAFTFRHAREIVSYLSALGISHTYTSPCLATAAGSVHGYDICDYNRINPELDGETAYEEFVQELSCCGMGHILDFVPNHMGIASPDNRWWQDVLERGPASPYADYFDIDWDSEIPELKGKVLFPVLGRPLEEVLALGELTLELHEGKLVLRYYDYKMPVAPGTVPTELESGIETLGEKLLGDRALFAELLERQFYRLVCWKAGTGKINYRRFFDVNHLAGLRVERPEVFAAVHELILNLIGDGKISGLRLDHVDGLFDPAGYFDRLQEAVLFQYASRDEVLQEVRPEILQEYIRRRREKESGKQQKDFALCPLFIVVEKILTGEEALPEHWAVHGTSGYDFLNNLNALFVDPANEKPFSDLYARFTGLTDSFTEVVYRSKKETMTLLLVSELDALTRSLHHISKKDRGYGDFAFDRLREALQEVVACLPLYRTYIDSERFDDEDRKTLEKTLARARQVSPFLQPEIFDFLQSVLLPAPGVVADPQKLNFIIKLQQFTGSVQAKGLEDTAFYRYNRLISVNEVGGEPRRFGLSPAEFHVRNQKRWKLWPRTFNATATHDHKRGEDVRARINVLSEIPEEWEKSVQGWAAINQSKRTEVDGQSAPDRNDEYLFYQTLLGVWTSRYENPAHLPELIERLIRYMDKAAKEAKVHAAWLNPNEAYSSAVERFIREVLDPSQDNPFPESFLALQKRVALLGAVNSLAQVVLKIAAPGVPDFYQGTELWDFSLVDPDNRCPVDFAARRRALEQLQPLLNGEMDVLKEELTRLLCGWEDGRIKMYVTAAGLRFRRECPDLFLYGDYLPVHVEGCQAGRLTAFVRQQDAKVCLAAAPRLIAGLTGSAPRVPVGKEVWGDTILILPPALAGMEIFRDRFTRREIRAARRGGFSVLSAKDVFSLLPVSLLESV